MFTYSLVELLLHYIYIYIYIYMCVCVCVPHIAIYTNKFNLFDQLIFDNIESYCLVNRVYDKVRNI